MKKIAIIVTSRATLGLSGTENLITIRKENDDLIYSKEFQPENGKYDTILLLKDDNYKELEKILNQIKSFQDKVMLGIAYHTQKGRYDDGEVKSSIEKRVKSHGIKMRLTPVPLPFSTSDKFNRELIKPLAIEEGSKNQRISHFDEIFAHFNKSVLLSRSLIFLHAVWLDDEQKTDDAKDDLIAAFEIIARQGEVIEEELDRIKKEKCTHIEKVIKNRDFLISKALEYSHSNRKQ